MIITEAFELVQANNLWHRIAFHQFRYMEAENHNTTYCGLYLINPPYKKRELFITEDWPTNETRCRNCESAYADALIQAAKNHKKRWKGIS